LAKYPVIPARLLQVDELTRADHFHLEDSDDCYFLWEWDGALYAESATTDFIGNFQKRPFFRGQPAWHYKEKAIDHAACAIAGTFPPQWLTRSTFVPVPPSKIKGDPDHDLRLMEALTRVYPRIADIREIVVQLANTQSRQKGILPADRAKNWKLDAKLFKPNPKHFVVFDDLLTGASHYAAMKIVLSRKFPTVPVSGIFLARRLRRSVIEDPST
jgi:hypothetical protein